MQIRRIKLLLTASILSAAATLSMAQEESEWVPLFNGKDLSNWTIKFTGFELGENYRNTFRVEDGLLRVVYDEWPSFDGEFGHLFTQEPYSHYRLRLEYRSGNKHPPPFSSCRGRGDLRVNPSHPNRQFRE